MAGAILPVIPPLACQSTLNKGHSALTTPPPTASCEIQFAPLIMPLGPLPGGMPQCQEGVAAKSYSLGSNIKHLGNFDGWMSNFRAPGTCATPLKNV